MWHIPPPPTIPSLFSCVALVDMDICGDAESLPVEALPPQAATALGGDAAAQSGGQEVDAETRTVPNHTKEPMSQMDDDELLEQDLSEDEDEDGCLEPFIQRYLPGVFVQVKLKTTQKSKDGGSEQLPMMVNFYSECMKAYKDERRFVYQEGYLGEKRDAAQYVAAREREKTQAVLSDSDGKPDTGPSEDHGPAAAESARSGSPDVTLEDVMWLKNRPNDPLLRCIQSITDRLNIQGIVGDPTSYLTAGGDDMHYDIDDPFIDDAAMLSALHMSKTDILRKKQMERDFSIWSEEDEEEEVELEAADFVAEYASELVQRLESESAQQKLDPLFFDPPGWRKYKLRVPKQFHSIFYDMEATFREFSGTVTTKELRKLVTRMLNLIFIRLTKIPEPRPKKPVVSDDVTATEGKEEVDEQRQLFERQGLNCVKTGKIVVLNGRILRWIVAALSEITNAVSSRDMHEEWIRTTLAHNQQNITVMRDNLADKLTPKVRLLVEKKGDKHLVKLSEHLRNLSKSVGALRKLMRDYETAYAAEVDQKKLDGPKLAKDVEGGKKAKGKQDVDGCVKLVITSQELTQHEGLGEAMISDDAKHAIKVERELECFGDILSDGSAREAKLGGVVIKAEQRGSPGGISTRSSQSGNRTPSTIEEEDTAGMVSSDGPAASQSDLDQTPAAGLNTDVTDSGSDVDSDNLSFTEMLRNSALWKRFNGLIAIYRLIASDLLMMVQMINLDLATCLTILATDFKDLVKDSVTTSYVFDKAYVIVADLVSRVVEEVSGVKLAITADVSRIAIMYLHDMSAVDTLFEEERKEPLLFYDNSDVAAAPGRVHFVGIRRIRRPTAAANAKKPVTESTGSAKRESPNGGKADSRQKEGSSVAGNSKVRRTNPPSKGNTSVKPEATDVSKEIKKEKGAVSKKRGVGVSPQASTKSHGTSAPKPPTARSAGDASSKAKDPPGGSERPVRTVSPTKMHLRSRKIYQVGSVETIVEKPVTRSAHRRLNSL
ncbi:uncharacterized protein BcabD6B2_29800 [Babesia caballi]|uniref:Hpc2-related domain-containing protein n=1 Tax=Babesia caballi TaxID=5871 RepID=A0AAV4LV11_BABCB|nr:hypothetical protein, conserved [Babesia caballi]